MYIPCFKRGARVLQFNDKQARNGWMVALVVDDGGAPPAKNSGGFSARVTMKMYLNFVELYNFV